MSSDIAAINAQILEAKGDKAKFQGGTIAALVEARIQTLLLNRSILEMRLMALERGTQPQIIDLPSVMPDSKLASEILAEIAAQEKKIAELKKDAEGVGGLVQGLKLVEVRLSR